MIENILFDFDGTVFDTVEGITKCVQYALGKMGIEAELSELKCFAGPPLVEMFAQKYGMSEDEAKEATRLYRERYEPIGWSECRPFEGMHEMLLRLKSAGKTLAIATSKPEHLAVKILSQYGMLDDFDLVCGATLDGSRSKKWDVINYALEKLGADPGKTLMVGDRMYDVIGAKKCGIDCVGVSFGYAEEGELSGHGAVYVADTPDELYEYIMR